jgi:hypothetical protein
MTAMTNATIAWSCSACPRSGGVLAADSAWTILSENGLVARQRCVIVRRWLKIGKLTVPIRARRHEIRESEANAASARSEISKRSHCARKLVANMGREPGCARSAARSPLRARAKNSLSNGGRASREIEKTKPSEFMKTLTAVSNKRVASDYGDIEVNIKTLEANTVLDCRERLKGTELTHLDRGPCLP